MLRAPAQQGIVVLLLDCSVHVFAIFRTIWLAVPFKQTSVSCVTIRKPNTFPHQFTTFPTFSPNAHNGHICFCISTLITWCSRRKHPPNNGCCTVQEHFLKPYVESPFHQRLFFTYTMDTSNCDCIFWVLSMKCYANFRLLSWLLNILFILDIDPPLRVLCSEESPEMGTFPIPYSLTLVSPTCEGSRPNNNNK
jgi:hypothetical protein